MRPFDLKVLAFSATVAGFACSAAREPDLAPAARPAASVPPSSAITAAFDSAIAAIRAQNFSAAETHFERALTHAPGHPLIIEQLMRLRARQRDAAGALEAFRLLSPIGSARVVRGDTLYDFMLPNAEFDQLAEQLAARSAPIVRSDTAAVVDDEDLLVESIALHAAPGGRQELMLGSMRTGRIVAVPMGGGPARTIAQTNGRVLGIKLAAPNTLWANVWYPPRADSGAPPIRGRSEIVVLDIPSGRVQRTVRSPDDDASHLFNDVAFARGRAYITDTDAHRVYSISTTAGALDLRELSQASSAFTSPNGIATAADGRRLYVAHVEGISLWDPASGTRALLPSVTGAPTTGIDGLYSCGGALIGVQNAVGLDRIVWLELSRDGTRITGGRVLEQRHPAARQPTTGLVHGENFYYVLTSDVARQRAGGPLLPSTGPKNTVIARLKLPVSCPSIL